MQKWSKYIIVIILILIVSVVIIKKNNKSKPRITTPSIKTDTISKDTIQPMSESAPVLIKSHEIKFAKNEIASINGFKITIDYFDKQFQNLPEQYKVMYKNDKEGFLEQLIIRELLYQEAVRKGFDKGLDYIIDTEQRKDEAINRYINDFNQKIQVTETEIQAFYNERKNEMGGATYEQVKNNIRNFLIQQKQGELLPQLIDDLMTKASIVKNEQWLKQQRALKPINPLDKALKNGLPTVLDLGSMTCVPCKMMKPIFDQLEKEYKGKANIILLDIYENRDLAIQYRVRVIPTQIFFDKNGNQYWRHEGYLAKEEIVKKLKELGVE